MKFYLFLFRILLLFAAFGTWAQELPPIINYTPDVYLAGNQNWAITQTEDNTIYVANNDGLLEFKGARWHLYPSPNKSIIRSVLAVENRVYTGCYMDFGYWDQDENKNRVYHSLSKELQLPLLEDEQFWNILTYENWILFQSLDRIYFYNTEEHTIHFIAPGNRIHKMYRSGGDLYYQVLSEGLFVIKNGEGVLKSAAPVFKDEIITSLYSRENTLYAVTGGQGIYKLKNDVVTKWEVSANTLLEQASVYNSVTLADQSILIGTIANGIYVISSEGDILYNIYQTNGLSDNTALSLFEDNNQNIWIGLDNGIDCVNLTSAFSNYIDRRGSLGTVYAAKKFNDFLYLGTNQGLFYKEWNTDAPFQFVTGTQGQVWCLTQVDNTLFCGHNSGTYVVDQGKATLISKVMGTWNIKKIPNKPNLLLQGNYDGLHILSRGGTSWKIRNKLKGFDIASKHVEITKSNEILVSHEYKGVYKLIPDDSLYTIQETLQESSVKKGAHSALVSYDNRILYANEAGIFYYDETASTFTIESKLSSSFKEDAYVSGVMISESDTKLWLFTKHYINLVTKDKINNTYKTRKIPIKETLRSQMNGYENISRIEDDVYLIGTSNGYLLMDLDKTFKQQSKVSLNRIQSGTSSDTSVMVSFKEMQLEPNENFIRFEYSVPIYQKFLEAEYQYRLLKDGVGDWSSWSTSSSMSFQNMPFGNYQFQVKAKINNEELEHVASHSFIVKKPWYASNLAIIIYVVLCVLIFILVNSMYSVYFKRQRERLLAQSTRELKLKELEAQKEIIQLKNESLHQDISARNRELAISTMSTIKKNEALNSIKQELLKITNTNAIGGVVKVIDETMNDIKDWKFFEEAFNNADKDFFKKVKELHPGLSANDLRLCVYLRLNLSSKEIAPLLNISPRSVEIKRYRLRKKINLDTEVKLNDYFINL